MQAIATQRGAFLPLQQALPEMILMTHMTIIMMLVTLMTLITYNNDDVYEDVDDGYPTDYVWVNSQSMI